MKQKSSFDVPKVKRLMKVRCSASEWAKDLSAVYHMKYVDGALVCAEGSVRTELIVPRNGGDLYGSNRDLYVIGSNIVASMFQRMEYIGLSEANEIRDYYLINGTSAEYVLTETMGIYITMGGLYILKEHGGGSSMDFYRERLFFCKGTRLNWSIAYQNGGLASDKTVNGSGYLDITNCGLGDMKRVIAFNDKLYVFHEHGISEIFGYGEAMNFTARKTGYLNGTLVPKSLLLCGNKVYYFTDRGFFSFDGSENRRVRVYGTEGIDFTQALSSFRANGEYWLCFTGTDGNKGIFVYDPAVGYSRLVEVDYESAAGCRDGAYYLKDMTIYNIAGKAMPVGKPCSMTTVLTVPCYSYEQCYLESLTVEGAGMFEIEVRSEGAVRRMRGQAGKRLRLNAALKGTQFTVGISSSDVDFGIEAIELGLRRENLA